LADSPRLLDTSALFAFIEDEPGADRVETLLNQRGSMITWVSKFEIYYITIQERGRSHQSRAQGFVCRCAHCCVFKDSRSDTGS